MKTECIEVLQVKSPEDLMEVDMDYILDYYPFDMLENSWVDIPDSVELIDISNLPSFEAELIVVVHDNLFLEPVQIYKKGNKYYLESDVLDELF